MPKPHPRTLRVEILEGRFLPSGSLAAPLSGQVHGGKSHHSGIITTSATTTAADEDDSKTHAPVDARTSAEKTHQFHSADSSHHGVVKHPPVQRHPKHKKEKKSAGHSEKGDQSPHSSPDQGEHTPVVHTDPAPTPSHTDALPQQPAVEDDLPLESTSSPPAADTKATSAPDTQTEAAAAPRHARAVAPTADGTQNDSGATAMLLAGAGVPSSSPGRMLTTGHAAPGPTLHAAAAADLAPGQNGQALLAALVPKVPDDSPAGNGRVGPVAPALNQTGQEVQYAPEVVPGGDVAADRPMAGLALPALAEAVLPAYSTVLTDILPIDVSTLESSISVFFEQVESLGSSLRESRFSLLFSASVVAAMAVGLEVSRRKRKTVTPTLALGGQGIPYSDWE
jgi:hypothetical protein